MPCAVRTPMKHCLACLFLFALISPLCGQTQWNGKIGNDDVVVTIPESTLLEQPSWNPRKSETPAPPIELHAAIDLAKKAVWDAHPDFKERQWNYSISLNEVSHGINDGSIVVDAQGREWFRRKQEITIFTAWVYCVRFVEAPPVISDGPTSPGPRFPVAVLFDGSVVLPKKIEKKSVDTATLERDYKRILSPDEP